MFLFGVVAGQPVEWLVDTGCSTTILASHKWDQLHPQDRPALRPYAGTLLSADSTPIQVRGCAQLTLSLQGRLLQHNILVASIANEGLLGLDFLNSHGLVIDFGTKEVMWEGEPVPSISRRIQTQACRIRLTEDVVIPAGTRTLVPATANKPLDPAQYLIEPLQRTPGGQPVLTGRTIVQGRGHPVPVEILNPTEEDIQLRKDTHVGIAQVVGDAEVTSLAEDRVREVRLGGGDRGAPVRPVAQATLAPELQELVDAVEAPMGDDAKCQLTQLLSSNQDLFALKGQPLGRTDLVLHDVNTGDAPPIKQHVRRPPIHQREQAQTEVDKMLAQGIIEPSQSPWASPVVLVKKKDGTMRYCVDYRQLNSVTRKDSYPLPRIDDSLESLGSAKYFSTLDLASGYWQVGLTDAAKEKSAFCTTSGLFQFNVMPFGLANAPATFQRLMERVLTGLQWDICLVYLDDVIVFSPTLEGHFDRLAQVFARIRSAGLKLKPTKCHLLQRQVGYLGHVVSEDGIQTDPDKTRAVEEWPTPRTVGDVRSFMGLCGYYRRFVPDFATLAKPLVQLTEKNKTFSWGEAEAAAFHQLKHLLTTAPILGYPDPKLPFVLDTDASDVGIGAVLSQVCDGKERVIAYGSRTLTKAERRYCITRRELLAVVHFSKAYRHFLSGARFLLRTDHAALKWLKSFKEPEGQLARWLETLETYDFELQHRPGAKHGNADALSRGPCPQCDGPHPGQVIRKGRAPRAAPAPPDHRPAVEPASAATPQPASADHPRRPDVPTPAEADQVARPVVTRRQRRPAAAGNQTPVAAPNTSSNWMATLDFNAQTLQDAQSADPDVSQVRTWIQMSQRPPFADIKGEGPHLKFLWGQYPCLQVEGGLVTRRLTRPGFPDRRQVLLPAQLRRQAFQMAHEGRVGGHLGVTKTLASLRQRFLWPGMRPDVQQRTAACDVCAAHKAPQEPRRAPLHNFSVGSPLERVTIDIVGPFPETPRGNKYALVAVDCFTKYLEVFPMPNMEAVTVAEALVTGFFTKYGIPTYLHSDQGTQFESQLFQEVCRMLGVKKTRTTPFRPQSDGQSERSIRTLTKMIAMATKDQHEWDTCLPFISMAYRATPQESTGMSPNLLMFGRETTMPVDLLIGLPQDTPQETTQYAQQLRERMESAHELARRHLRQAAVRQKRTYDAGVKGATFREGELAWVANKIRRKGVSPKLAPKWRGPGVVTRMISDVTAEVQLSAQKRVTVHTDMLKHCSSEARPRWMQRALAQVKARQQQEARGPRHQSVSTQTLHNTNDDNRDEPVTVDAPAATSAAPADHEQQPLSLNNSPPGSRGRRPSEVPRRRSRRFTSSPVSDPSTDPASSQQPSRSPSPLGSPGNTSGTAPAGNDLQRSSRPPSGRTSNTPAPDPADRQRPPTRSPQVPSVLATPSDAVSQPLQVCSRQPSLQPDSLPHPSPAPAATYPCHLDARDPCMPGPMTAPAQGTWHYTGYPPMPMPNIMAPAARIYPAQCVY